MQMFLSLLTENPAVRAMQIGLIVLAVIAVYLVFFATRDILLRSKSFVYQLVSILLTAGLPIVGFFLYLLIRPATTIRQREFEKLVRESLGHGKKKKHDDDEKDA